MRAFAVSFVGLLALSGCAAQPYTIQTPFNDAEMAWSQSPGTAAIKGQGFLKTVGGDVKTCAGNVVSLVPDTPYT